MGKFTDAIKHLIIINVILYFLPQLLNMDLTNILALHFPKNEHFGFWQYVTHIFMHGSIGHLLFNMLGLWMFGSMVEQYIGTKRFLFLYLSAGIGAGFLHHSIQYFQFNEIYSIFLNNGLNTSEAIEILIQQKTSDFRVINNITQEQFNEVTSLYASTTVGASGAVFGIFASSAVYFPNLKTMIFPIPFPLLNKAVVTCFVVSDLILGTFSMPNDNIARFAHVGGALVGFIIAYTWKTKKITNV